MNGSVLFRCTAIAIIVVAGWTCTVSVEASYMSLNIPGAVDYTFDSSDTLYATAGSSIDRFNTKTDTFLTPFSLPGSNLGGIDISPDGKTLAVADFTNQGTTDRVWLVNTATGASTAVSFPLAFGEGGTFTVAWESNGQLLVSSTFDGSGTVPLRQYNPQTKQTTVLRMVEQNTMLTPSADRKTIGLAEANISSGPIDVFSVASGSIVSTFDTNWFTYDVAVSPNGNTFVAPTYDGAFVLDRSGNTLSQQTLLGQYASHGPLYAVFDPASSTLFTSEYDYNGELSGIKAYNTATWQQTATIDNYNFPNDGNDALGPGWLEVSPDGHWLVASVSGGARLYDVSSFGLISVPEPSAIALASMATLGLLIVARRRKPDHEKRRRSV